MREQRGYTNASRNKHDRFEPIVFNPCAIWSIHIELQGQVVGSLFHQLAQLCCEGAISELLHQDSGCTVTWGRTDGEWVPLECGDARDVQEEILARVVPHWGESPAPWAGTPILNQKLE